MSNLINIAIFDYGAGNLYSLKHSLEKNGATVTIVNKLGKSEDYEGLVLPGVGNFDPASRIIKPYKKKLCELIEKNIPILGICLGMEMLFKNSEEGKLQGLNILDGKVIILPKKNVKIPHMGWNSLDIINKNSMILQDIKDKSWVYFVHSYHIVPSKKNIIIAKSRYGKNIPVVIEKNNLFGTQFHPEKSGKIGGKIIENFLQVCNQKR